MAALTGLSDLINRLSGGNNGTPELLMRWVDARIAGVASATVLGRWTSLWQVDGSPTFGGATPTTVANPDSTFNGGLKQTNPGGGRTKYLISGAMTSGTGGILLVYDRLLHIGGFDGTLGTAQNVGGSLTRYTDGIGNQAWVEIYTTIGTTSRTFTLSYSNTTPTSGRATPAINIGAAGLDEAGRMIPCQLQLGDSGVSAVASLTLSGNTNASGNFGVNIIHPIMLLPYFPAGAGIMRDGIFQPALPEVKTDACLALAWFAASTGAFTPSGWMNFNFVEA